jgi:hypothetical protein
MAKVHLIQKKCFVKYISALHYEKLRRQKCEGFERWKTIVKREGMEV